MTKMFPPHLKKLLEESALELAASTDGLSDYQLVSGQASEETGQAQVEYASVLGFSGDLIKGSLVLACNKTLLEKSHPNIAMEMPVGEPEVLDWVGEIANQLLGRLKNKIAAAGIKFSMSTPTNMCGKSMQVTTPKDGHALGLCYKGSHGDLVIHLSTVIDASVNFDAVVNNSQVASEGGAILF